MPKLHALFVVFLIAVAASFLHSSTLERFAFGAFTGQIVPIVPTEAATHRSVVFVGDVMLARKVEFLMNQHGSDYPFLRLDPFRSDAYVIGNFESAMAPQHVQTPFYTFSFSTDPKHVPALRTAGFTHLSLANNHTYDKGSDGYQFAVQSLTTNDLTSFGHPERIDEDAVTLLSLGDVTIAVVGLHAVTRTPSDQELERVFEMAAMQSDMQIAYVHWGNEYAPQHSKSQTDFAERLANAGADMIVGHHPHVVQDIGFVGDIPVFYSLGNFIFDQYFSMPVQEGLMLELTPEDSNLVVTLKPVTSIDMQSVPRKMTKAEAAVFLSSLAKRSDERLSAMIPDGRLVFALPLAKD